MIEGSIGSFPYLGWVGTLGKTVPVTVAGSMAEVDEAPSVGEGPVEDAVSSEGLEADLEAGRAVVEADMVGPASRGIHVAGGLCEAGSCRGTIACRASATRDALKRRRHNQMSARTDISCIVLRNSVLNALQPQPRPQAGMSTTGEVYKGNAMSRGRKREKTRLIQPRTEEVERRDSLMVKYGTHAQTTGQGKAGCL